MSLTVRKHYVDWMAGHSIPAMEHSTVTSWKKEEDAFKNMLEQFPTGLVACVSDSYDIFNACHSIWGEKLKGLVETRDGCLVIRPDSGNPLEVLPMVFQILSEQFGFTTNSKGYKVLPPKIRVIQGDGIDAESMNNILECLTNNKWSIDNIAFGSGGGLLQKHNRDTLKCAMKCSYIEVKDVGRNVFKEPITDKGKKSFKGKLKLMKYRDDSMLRDKTKKPGLKWTTWEECQLFHRQPKELINDWEMEDCLQTVFLNGDFVKNFTLTNIRNRITKHLIEERLSPSMVID